MSVTQDIQSTTAIFLDSLDERQRDIVSRRFGLHANEHPSTLEDIGQQYGLCRERIRQIQNQAMRRARETVGDDHSIFDELYAHLQKHGGLRREDMLLREVGGEDTANHVAFLLEFNPRFSQKRENNNFHTLWYTEKEAINRAHKAVERARKALETARRELTFAVLHKEARQAHDISEEAFHSIVEATKHLSWSPLTAGNTDIPDALLGLANWPQIKPRGVRDKAAIALQRAGRPLHFTEVADMINRVFGADNRRPALPQTVHNELIKDDRFVLVGRGLYALRDWGYLEGTVKEVIAQLLERSGRPMSREEILEEVHKQRDVKDNTILLNLSGRDTFKRNEDGTYSLR